MKQAGRQTEKRGEDFGPLDYFAEDVRRVLKRAKAPCEWGDAEAFFLMALVSEPGFMFALGNRDAQSSRANTFAALNASYDGDFFKLLHQIANAVGKRMAKKNFTTKQWKIVGLVSFHAEEIRENLNPSNTLPYSHEALNIFWNCKALVAADHFGKLFNEKFTAKDIEKARAAVRKLNPFFSNPVREISIQSGDTARWRRMHS